MLSAVGDVMLFPESQHQREVNAMALQQRKYDADLQMFVDPPREPDMQRLAFLRWLVERRRLEHGPTGPSSGPLTLWSSGSIRSTDDLQAA
jgi:hypothetical protein